MPALYMLEMGSGRKCGVSMEIHFTVKVDRDVLMLVLRVFLGQLILLCGHASLLRF